VGVLPCVPGFLATAFPAAYPNVAPFFKGLYSYAWFVGFGAAAVVYVVLSGGKVKR
jgi:NCS1 family nucleobase:cation symporter-1